MKLAAQVAELFHGYQFGTPANLDDLERAERKLGEPIPPVLRDLYLAFDGFLGPTNAQFFWPLFAENGLVHFNNFLRAGDEFPHEFVSSCIFFGDEGIGAMWGIKCDLPDTIICWDAEWGEDYEIAGASPLDAWTRAKRDYDGLLNG